MKTDALVEDEEFDGYYQRPQPKAPTQPQSSSNKPQKSHSSAAWIMDNHQQLETMLNPRNVFKQKDDTYQVQLDPSPQSIAISTDAEQASSSKVPAHSQHSVDQYAPRESPLAPLSTTVNESRQDLSSPKMSPLKQQSNASDDIVDTSLSSPITSHTKSMSTSQSSAAPTSSRTSKRDSDNVYSRQASAREGQWMKEEIEKHRKAQDPSSTGASSAGGILANSPRSFQYATNRPASQNRIKSFNSMHDNKSAGTFLDANSRPESRPSSQIVESPQPSKSQTSSPTSSSFRHAGDSRRSSRPSSTPRSSHEAIKRDSPSNSAVHLDVQDIPPVPRLDTVRRSQLSSGAHSPNLAAIAKQNTSPSAPDNQTTIQGQLQQQRRGKPTDSMALNAGDTAQSHIVSQLTANRNTRSSAEPEPMFRSAALAQRLSGPSAPPRMVNIQPGSQWPIVQDELSKPPETDNTNPPSTAGKVPAKHQNDDSVLVRDFGGPAKSDEVNTTSRNPIPTTTSTTTPGSPTRDSKSGPTPADFDALNTAMNERDVARLSIQGARFKDSRSNTMPNFVSPTGLNGVQATSVRIPPRESSSPTKRRHTPQPLNTSSGKPLSSHPATPLSPAHPNPLMEHPTESRLSSLNAASSSTGTGRATGPMDVYTAIRTTSPPNASTDGTSIIGAAIAEANRTPVPAKSSRRTNAGADGPNASSADDDNMPVTSPTIQNAPNSSATNNQKELRGLSKLFYRLGGGEMPSRRSAAGTTGGASAGRASSRPGSQISHDRGYSTSSRQSYRRSMSLMSMSGGGAASRRRSKTLHHEQNSPAYPGYAGLGQGSYGMGPYGSLTVAGTENDGDSDYDEEACAAPVVGFGRGF